MKWSNWWVVILVVTIPVIASEQCHPHDKRALLGIKQESFNNSIFLEQQWKPNSDCCTSWSYVHCDDTTNRVNSFILLSSDTPNTPFPSSLGDLPYLEELIFVNNATGPIPSTLSKLRRIVDLDLSNNLLTGPIPSFFASFQNLSTLYLYNNLLTGSIPHSLPLAPSLTRIGLSGNRLTGPIPDSFASLSDDIERVDLADNMLDGEIPRSLQRVKFRSLDVSGNRLRGDPSFLLGEDKTMSELDLSRNDFAFNMTGLGFPPMMNALDLSHNRIYGSLPKALSTLPSLARFNVTYNRLCGKIPTGGTLPRFDSTSYFHNKCLCGTPLPPCH